MYLLQRKSVFPNLTIWGSLSTQQLFRTQWKDKNVNRPSFWNKITGRARQIFSTIQLTCRRRPGIIKAFCGIRSWIRGTYPASRRRYDDVDVSAGSRRRQPLSAPPDVCHISGDHKFSTSENLALIRLSDKNTDMYNCVYRTGCSA